MIDTQSILSVSAQAFQQAQSVHQVLACSRNPPLTTRPPSNFIFQTSNFILHTSLFKGYTFFMSPKQSRMLLLRPMGAMVGTAVLFLLAVPGLLQGQSDFLRRSEERAREILNKTVEALGGEAYLMAQNIVRKGKFYQFRRDVPRGSNQFRTVVAPPWKRRVEFGKKARIVLINDGEQGWKIEYKNVKTQTEEELRNYRIDTKHDLDHILRFRLREKGLKVRYLGKSRTHLEQLDGVQLMDASGDKVRIFVNSRTFLPVRMEYESPPRGKRWATEDEKFFHNYHEIDGVRIPFTIILNSNGYKAMETQLSSAQINADLSDTLFSSPEK